MGVPKDSGASLGTRRAPHGPTSTPGAWPGRAAAAARTAARAASAGNPRGVPTTAPPRPQPGLHGHENHPEQHPREHRHRRGSVQSCTNWDQQRAAAQPLGRALGTSPPGSCCLKRGGAPLDWEGGWGDTRQGAGGSPRCRAATARPSWPPLRAWGAAEKTEVGPGEPPRPSRRHQIFLIPPAGITNKTPVPTANKTSLLLQA